MSNLLKKREYIDLVELSRFVTDKYGWPPLGQADSFHSWFSEIMGWPGQNELVHFDMLDKYHDQEGEAFQRVFETFEKLIADGYLPKRDEYAVEVWW